MRRLIVVTGRRFHFRAVADVSLLIEAAFRSGTLRCGVAPASTLNGQPAWLGIGRSSRRQRRAVFMAAPSPFACIRRRPHDAPAAHARRRICGDAVARARRCRYPCSGAKSLTPPCGALRPVPRRPVHSDRAGPRTTGRRAKRVGWESCAALQAQIGLREDLLGRLELALELTSEHPPAGGESDEGARRPHTAPGRRRGGGAGVSASGRGRPAAVLDWTTTCAPGRDGAHVADGMLGVGASAYQGCPRRRPRAA